MFFLDSVSRKYTYNRPVGRIHDDLAFWVIQFGQRGKPFYFNTHTGESCISRPLELSRFSKEQLSALWQPVERNGSTQYYHRVLKKFFKRKPAVLCTFKHGLRASVADPTEWIILNNPNGLQFLHKILDYKTCEIPRCLSPRDGELSADFDDIEALLDIIPPAAA